MYACLLKGPDLCLQVLFGTADGQVIVMDCHGRMLAHVLLHESDGILSMSWNYPIFLVEDSSESDTDSDDYSPPQGTQLLSLIVTAFDRVTPLREECPPLPLPPSLSLM